MSIGKFGQQFGGFVSGFGLGGHGGSGSEMMLGMLGVFVPFLGYGCCENLVVLGLGVSSWISTLVSATIDLLGGVWGCGGVVDGLALISSLKIRLSGFEGCWGLSYYVKSFRRW